MATSNRALEDNRQKTVDGYEKVVDEIERQVPPTHALWRLKNTELKKNLERFAKGEAEEKTWEDLYEKVIVLFRDINVQLANQEKRELPPDEKRIEVKNDYSIVIGGKYSDQPKSIPEALIEQLVDMGCVRVVTASRSETPNKTHEKCMHISKKNFFENKLDVGGQEFFEVLSEALEEWQNKYNESNLVIYFTLGLHTGGAKGMLKNLTVADNFCKALLQCRKYFNHSKNWRIVVTGTDATLSSTTKDVKREEYIIPTYKIHKYNFGYAMSKLGQYAIVAQAVTQLFSNEEQDTDLSKIRDHLTNADEITYDPKTAIISMEELDEMSERIIKKCNQTPHLWVAQDISICYTPLHGRPWTEKAMNLELPRLQILENIIRRLKNAISIERAATYHFEPLFK